MNPQELLYPRTRFEVLKALHNSPSGVPLREIAYRSDVVVSNVQRAIEYLLAKKFIAAKKVENRIYYFISNKKVDELVSNIIKIFEPFEIEFKSEAKALKERSKYLVKNIDERAKIIRKAKESLKT